MNKNSENYNQQDCQLLIIDKNNKVTFYNKCRIGIHELSKEISFKPTDKDLIRASFERCFVCQNSIICINESESDPNKHVLILPDIVNCKTITTLIEANSTKTREDNDAKFQSNFLGHIIKEHENGSLLTPILEKILNIYTGVEQTATESDAEDKEEDPDDAEKGEVVAVGSTMDEDSVAVVAEEQNSTSNSEVNERIIVAEECEHKEETIEARKSSRKRKLTVKGENFFSKKNNTNFNDSEASSSSKKATSPPFKQQKFAASLPSKMSLCSSSTSQPLQETTFSNKYLIKKDCENGITLYVFDENDKRLCQQFTWNKKKNLFVCVLCQKENVLHWAEVLDDENGDEVVEIGPNEHCKLQKFVS
uniref:Uncharacterized protein n=1 Tax=Panagrolaimus davidi TaxID=227884 RepID=A0A914Q4K4_9BILA